MGYNTVAVVIHLAIVVSEICKIPRNSPKIRTYSSSRSSKDIDLGVNRNRICNFPVVINRNWTYRLPFSTHWRIWLENSLYFPHPILVLRSLAEQRHVIGYQHNLYTAEKNVQCATIPSLTIWVYLQSFSRCWLPNLRNSERIPTYSRSGSSKFFSPR